MALLAAGLTLGVVAVATALPNGSPVSTVLPAPAPAETGSGMPETTATAATSGTGATERGRTAPRGSISAAAGIRELRTAGNGRNSVTVAADGAVTTATAPAGKALATSGADAFTARYAAAFGLTSAHTLTKAGSETLPGGDTVSRYQQTAGGLPILGGQIVVTSRGKQVRAAIAETSVRTPVSTKATVAAGTAAQTALTSAAAEIGLPAATLRAGKPALTLFDPALLGAAGAAGLRPTWQVEITDADGGEVATVLVDGLDGTTRLTMSERQTARNRIVCDLANAAVNLDIASTYACTSGTALGQKASTRTEGEGASGIADIDRAYDMLGATYDYYKSNFGVDSFDGRGAQLRATVRACYKSTLGTACPYENAFWEGTQFVFGAGFATDDVVAHEYTHAVTEWSSHLIYAYQSGAINEALSDIMGEFVDQQYVAANEANPALLWQLGEDLPGGAIRSMNNPAVHGQPSQVGDAYWYKGQADSGGVHTNSGVANHAAYLIAAGPGGIGNAKSAQLWWRVMHLLPSGAGYEMLSQTLKSACTQLTGRFGFTPADCTVVAEVADTGMSESLYATNTYKGVHCLGSDSADAQPYDTLYFDGFEKPGTWPTTSSYYWLNIPSSVAQYQYAATGSGSLNGWSPNTGGNGTTATMPRSVTLPADAYLFFNHSALDPSTSAGVDLQVSVNGGTWTAMAIPSSSLTIVGRLEQRSGYTGEMIDLAAYAGKSVRFRFVLRTASNTNLFDWYVDDFRVYTCAQRPSAPTGYAYYDGSTAVVGGLLTNFLPYQPAGQTLDHYELSYSSPLPGAPTSIPASQAVPAGFTLAGTDGISRTVKVRAVTNTGVAGDWAYLQLTTSAPVNCQRVAYSVFKPLGRNCSVVLPRR